MVSNIISRRIGKSDLIATLRFAISDSCLALHRYLKWRDPNYHYETDFGGVFYLFLRGMAVQNNAQTGVYFTKPSVELIENWINYGVNDVGIITTITRSKID